MNISTYLLETSDELFRLAKTTIEYNISRKDLATALEALANEFLARAVEIDTARDKTAKAS